MRGVSSRFGASTRPMRGSTLRASAHSRCRPGRRPASRSPRAGQSPSAWRRSSSPAMNMSGSPPLRVGSTMTSAMTVLSPFTTRAWGSRRWMRSPSESVVPTNRPGRPEEKSSGSLASRTTFPLKLSMPASRTTSSAALPRTDKTTSSPKRAASLEAADVSVRARRRLARAPVWRVAGAEHYGMPALEECRAECLGRRPGAQDADSRSRAHGAVTSGAAAAGSRRTRRRGSRAR